MVMYNGKISRDGVAAAARDVLATWQDGDHVAARVVQQGLDALARRVTSVAHRLHLSDADVRLSGGVFRSEPYVDAFRAAVQAGLPQASVQRARLTPAAGAVLLALRAGHVAVTDSLRANLLASAHEGRL